MANKILLVTSPDDSLLDGIRVLLIDLSPEQTQLVSDALTALEEIPNIVVYIWKNGESNDWLLDKKHKSNAVIFNADSENQTIVGYMAAQHNSYYFGTLKSLSKANNSAIYTTDDCFSILTDIINK